MSGSLKKASKKSGTAEYFVSFFETEFFCFTGEQFPIE